MTFPRVMVDTTNSSILVSLFNATVGGTVETTTAMDKFRGIPGEKIFYSWFPTVFLGIFMVLFLLISFARYHRKFVRKRNAQNEYLEYQLAVKHPRIGSSFCKPHVKGYAELAASVGFGVLRQVLADGGPIEDLSESRFDNPPGVALTSKATKKKKSDKQFISRSMEIPGTLIGNVHEGMDAHGKDIFAKKYVDKDVRKGEKNRTLKTSKSFQGRYDVTSCSENPADRIVDFNSNGESSADYEDSPHYSNVAKNSGVLKTDAISNRNLAITYDPNMKSGVEADYYSNRDNNPFVSEEFNNVAICQHCRHIKRNSYYEDLGLPFATQKEKRKNRKATSSKTGGFMNYGTAHIPVESLGEIGSPTFDSARHLPLLDSQYYENVPKEIFKGSIVEQRDSSFVGLRRNNAFQYDFNVVNNTIKAEVEVYTLNNNQQGESGTCEANNTDQVNERKLLEPECKPLYFDFCAKGNYSKDISGCVFQHTNEKGDAAKHKNRNGQKKARTNSRNRPRAEASSACEDGKVFWLDVDNISTTSL